MQIRAIGSSQIRVAVRPVASRRISRRISEEYEWAAPEWFYEPAAPEPAPVEYEPVYGPPAPAPAAPEPAGETIYVYDPGIGYVEVDKGTGIVVWDPVSGTNPYAEADIAQAEANIAAAQAAEQAAAQQAAVVVQQQAAAQAAAVAAADAKAVADKLAADAAAKLAATAVVVAKPAAPTSTWAWADQYNDKGVGVLAQAAARAGMSLDQYTTGFMSMGMKDAQNASATEQLRFIERLQDWTPGGTGTPAEGLARYNEYLAFMGQPTATNIEGAWKLYDASLDVMEAQQQVATAQVMADQAAAATAGLTIDQYYQKQAAAQAAANIAAGTATKPFVTAAQAAQAASAAAAAVAAARVATPATAAASTAAVTQTTAAAAAAKAAASTGPNKTVLIAGGVALAAAAVLGGVMLMRRKGGYRMAPARARA